MRISRASNGLVLVRFLTSHPPYSAGQVAGFSDGEAARLTASVRAGVAPVAEYYTPPGAASEEAPPPEPAELDLDPSDLDLPDPDPLADVPPARRFRTRRHR